MLDFYQKRKLRSVANSRITQAFLCVVVGFLAWQALERYVVAMTVAERREAIDQTAATLQARRDALEAEVRYLQDERGIEAEMRRQFDIALPGEEVVVILEDETEGGVRPLIATSTEPAAQSDGGWWPW